MYTNSKFQYSLRVEYLVGAVRDTKWSPSIVFHIHHELFQSLMELAGRERMEWGLLKRLNNTIPWSYQPRHDLRYIHGLEDGEGHLYPVRHLIP